MSRPFCAICVRCVLPLRLRQLEEGGPIFQICRRCDEQNAVTIQQRRPLQHRAPTGRGAGNRLYVPFDELHNDMTFRILRVVQRFDWINSIDIADILGIPGVTVDRCARNAYAVTLRRLTMWNYLRRRHLLEWHEYQITRTGRGWIERRERMVIKDLRTGAA